MPDTHSTNVIIVGAGPIGIELAVALKRDGIEYLQFDAGQVGSTIEWYAPNTHFFSSPERIAIAGVPLQTLDQTKATREEYLNYLRAVIQQFNLQINMFERVTGIVRGEDGSFDVTTQRSSGERRWKADKVVLAIGDMHRPRMIDVPGEDLPHVSHYFRDPHTYFKRKVLIVGGKNSAVEAAIRCVRIGAEVTLSYRGHEFDESRVKFWLLPEIRAMIRDGRMRFLPHTTVREIREDVVILSSTEGSGEPVVEVPAECVLLMTGYVQDPTLFEKLGVVLEGEGRKPEFDPGTMETNVQGLFVAGTASAGTQLGGVKEFIETSHVHVDRILAALKGETAPEAGPPDYDQPES
jgi:thioredoxin reductase (NADPH)